MLFHVFYSMLFYFYFSFYFYFILFSYFDTGGIYIGAHFDEL